MMIGSVMMLSAKAAASPDLGSPNSRMSSAKTNRPATIEGSAVAAAATVRTRFASRPGDSFMNTAQAMPSGTVMARVMVICSTVPTTACRTPPIEIGWTGPATRRSCV